MIRHECDRCKRSIDPNTELRYIVRMDVSSSLDAPDELVDDDRDYLLEIHELLERNGHVADRTLGSDGRPHESGADGRVQSTTFDLCPQCYEKFMNSPVGREASEPIGVSQN